MGKAYQVIALYLQKDWVIILLLLLGTIPAFHTLFFSGYFPHHDDLQVMRIFEMEKCFQTGQIPCRWVPDMGYGFGYPLFNFYPSFPSLLGAFVRLITHIQLVDTVKVSFALQIMTAATLMYLFAKQWWGRAGGVVSSLFYTYAPYHAVDLYVRGAVNESWGMAFAPGVGWAMTKLYQKQSIGNTILLAVMFSGMLLSHNLMVLIFTPLFVLFGLYLVIIRRSLRLLFYLASGGLLAILLCAFFTIPVILEQKYVHIDTLYYGYFNYTQHFVDLHQLFLSRFWGFGGSVYGPYDGLAFPIGWLHWGAVLVSMIAALWFLYRRSWRIFFLVAIFSSYFWFTAFLMHQRSTPIWSHLQILMTLQFPWRFLSTTTLTASFLVGGLFLLPLAKVVRWTLFAGLIIAVFAINIGYFHKEYAIPITDKDKLSGFLWEQERTAGIFDYLPIYAVAPPGRPANGDYQVMQGAANMANIQRGSASLKLTANAKTPTIVRLNIFDFPIWRVFVDGKQVAINHDNYLGLITFAVPPGAHIVSAQLTNSPIRTITNYVSLITFVMLVLYLLQSMLTRLRKRGTQII